MNDYKVRYSKPVIKYLKNLSKKDEKQLIFILKAIDEIKNNPNDSVILYGKFKGRKRKRKGKIRIIFELNDKNIIKILKIAKRSNIYKKIS